MPLEQIKKEIEAKEADDLSQMRKAAYAEAIKVVSEAEARAKQIADSSAAETESYISGKRRGMEASAEMEARKIGLEALDEALDAELKRIRKALIARLGQKSAPAIFARASKTADVLGDGFTVSINKKDARLAADVFKGAKVEYADIEGLLLYSSDKKIAIDMRLETLADSALEDAKGAILTALSGEKGSGSGSGRSGGTSGSPGIIKPQGRGKAEKRGRPAPRRVAHKEGQKGRGRPSRKAKAGRGPGRKASKPR
jgi:vacuolar-type H+-ATPase subunit E/Vma4